MRFLLLPLLALAAQPALAAERRHIVTDFDRVQIDGPFAVELRTGLPSAATVSGSTEAIGRVSVEVQGGLLRIRPNRSAWGGYPSEGAGPVRIRLATRDLRGVVVTGAGSIEVDRAEALRFDLTVSGNGRVAIGALEADRLILGSIGAGQVTLAGTAKSVRATVQGAGSLAAEALRTDDAEIATDTAGSIRLSVRRAAKVTAAGAGDVEILGPAACTVKSTGAGRVLCGN
jgi:hypothetical protein